MLLEAFKANLKETFTLSKSYKLERKENDGEIKRKKEKKKEKSKRTLPCVVLTVVKAVSLE